MPAKKSLAVVMSAMMPMKIRRLPWASRAALVDSVAQDAGEGKQRAATGALLVTLRELVAVRRSREAVDERDAVVRSFALLGHAGSLLEDSLCRQGC